MVNIGRYMVLLENRSDFEYPDIKTHIPTPTDVDYERGYIVRYFIRKANDNSSYIYEVNSDTYSNMIQNPFFTTVSLRWRISGEINEVRESNKKSVKLTSLKMKNIPLYLPNLLQFHYRNPSKVL
jgi:hypothetical protein